MMHSSKWSLLVKGTACVLLFVSCPRVYGAEKEARLDVQKVMLFTSGVGYFEHGGTVEGDVELSLPFAVGDINDVLKSMVLQDLDGGKISAVEYASATSGDTALRQLDIRLAPNTTLAGVLQQMQGEQVHLKHAEPVSGRIVSVEKRAVASDDGNQEAYDLNLLTDAGLQRIALADVGSIRIDDDALNERLASALDGLREKRSNDKRNVKLRFEGEGRRRVRVGYVRQVPIWKVTYRLVMTEKSALLQGWAIVENTGELPWENVELTLVSGNPISFAMNLYDPYFVSRPTVPLQLMAGSRPLVYESGARVRFAMPSRGAGGEGGRGRAEGRPMRGFGGGGLGGGAFGEAEADEVDDPFGEVATSVASAAATGEVGDQFEYKIKNRVSLASQNAAMFPIVNANVDVDKLDIFSQVIDASHPHRGVRLTNNTDLHLMRGPLSVFDEGAYAGDAQIKDTPPKAKRLISYAVDARVEVLSQRQPAQQTLTAVAVGDGLIMAKTRSEVTTRFTTKNLHGTAQAMLFEIPKAGWQPSEKTPPVETTKGFYRYAAQLPAGKTTETEVTLVRHQSTNIDLATSPMSVLRKFAAASETDAKTKQLLDKILATRLNLLKKQDKVRELGLFKSSIDEHQGRIRQNMQAIDRNSDLYRRYINKLKEQEDEIEQVDQEMSATVAALNQLKTELDSLTGRGKRNKAVQMQKANAPAADNDLDDLFGK